MRPTVGECSLSGRQTKGFALVKRRKDARTQASTHAPGTDFKMALRMKDESGCGSGPRPTSALPPGQRAIWWSWMLTVRIAGRGSSGSCPRSRQPSLRERAAAGGIYCSAIPADTSPVPTRRSRTYGPMAGSLSPRLRSTRAGTAIAGNAAATQTPWRRQNYRPIGWNGCLVALNCKDVTQGHMRHMLHRRRRVHREHRGHMTSSSRPPRKTWMRTCLLPWNRPSTRVCQRPSATGIGVCSTWPGAQSYPAIARLAHQQDRTLLSPVASENAAGYRHKRVRRFVVGFRGVMGGSQVCERRGDRDHCPRTCPEPVAHGCGAV